MKDELLRRARKNRQSKEKETFEAKNKEKDYNIEFTDEGLEIEPYTHEAAEIIHSEEFKEGVWQIIDDYTESKRNENKKD